MKNVAIIGSTGSIGTTCLDVIRNNPAEFKVTVLACGGNTSLLKKQIEEFKPSHAYTCAHEKLCGVKTLESLEQIAELSCVDVILFASSGFTSAKAVLAAMEHKKGILLANKETLVCAGEVITAKAKATGAEIFPVDSEHSAIWQCLEGKNTPINRLILTASGGAFRDTPKDKLAAMTAADALKHPNWSMGKKITVDSATLINKGLEIMEAKWLFGCDYDKIECVLHRESVIHSMVEFADHSVLAQMSYPTMEVPISLALSYPRRLPCKVKPLNFAELKQLTFEEIDRDKFPCLPLCERVARCGGILPAVLSAANEIAVERFLNGEIGFLQIHRVIEKTLVRFSNILHPTLQEIFSADVEARNIAREIPIQ